MAFERFCTTRGVPQSKGRVATCYDNAVAESFFSSFKVEFYYQHTHPGSLATKAEIAQWITFYNTTRFHSAPGHNSPPRRIEPHNPTPPDPSSLKQQEEKPTKLPKKQYAPHQTLEIEFTNIYKEKPNKPGKGGTSKIAKTGANATVLVTAAMLLMGAGVVAVRKRRK